MDFGAWLDVYLGGRWYTCDARHDEPRIGRVLMARRRDATDVAIVTSFAQGAHEGAPQARQIADHFDGLCMVEPVENFCAHVCCLCRQLRDRD
jgi:hypothetical protein